MRLLAGCRFCVALPRQPYGERRQQVRTIAWNAMTQPFELERRPFTTDTHNHTKPSVDSAAQFRRGAVYQRRLEQRLVRTHTSRDVETCSVRAEPGEVVDEIRVKHPHSRSRLA